MSGLSALYGIASSAVLCGRRVEQMEIATRQIAKSNRSVLSIGFVPSVLSAGLPSLVRRLRKHDPDLDLQLVEVMSIQQPEALTSGRIDIGFGRIRTSEPGIERLVLREERLVAAIPPSSRIARKRRRLSIRSILDESLIVYPKFPRPSFADHVLKTRSAHSSQARGDSRTQRYRLVGNAG